MQNPFLELLKISLGNASKLSSPPSRNEWKYIYDESQKQAIMGVMTDGLERLPAEQRPPKDIILQWIGFTQMVEARNRQMNERCLELQGIFASAGFKCCILKGQGNALLYPNPLYRQSGDIDIWVRPKDGNKDQLINRTIAFLMTRCDLYKQTIGYHHVEFPCFDDVEVEVHWRPSWKSSPLHNGRMQRWFGAMADKQFSNVDEKSGLHVPTWDFNVVYLLQHMYLHLFQEGLGLRQFVDYYYLLTSNKRVKLDNLEDTLKRLDLYHFAGAVMYVLYEAFGMDEKYFILPVDKNRGSFLLDEIMRSGNFGQYDDRNRELAQKTGISRSLARLKRQYRFLRHYPVEALCAPFQVFHVMWRKLRLWRWE